MGLDGGLPLFGFLVFADFFSLVRVTFPAEPEACSVLSGLGVRRERSGLILPISLRLGGSVAARIMQCFE